MSVYDSRFAQSAEAVDRERPDPARAAIEREGVALLKAAESAAARLAELVADGADAEAVRLAEKRYEKKLKAWMEFADVGRTHDELASGTADVFDEWRPKTLGDFLGRDLQTGQALEDWQKEFILEAWERFLGWHFDDWRCNPVQGFKRILATARRTRPQYLHEQGLTQQDVAIILGETKQAVSTRERAKLEVKLAKMGVMGARLGGNLKSDETREKCRRAQMGNENRKTAAARARAEGRG